MGKEIAEIVRRVVLRNYLITWMKYSFGERISVFKKRNKKVPIASFMPNELGWFYAIKFVDMIENI